MSLTGRYMVSQKNIPAIFQKIVSGAVPEKFTTEHLKAIGFGASNDRAIIPLLKDLKFLSEAGAPTERYREYRDTSRSKLVLGEALREIYSDLFVIDEKIGDAHREAIEGRFRAVHGATDSVAQRQAATFLALARLADLSGPFHAPVIAHRVDEQREPPPALEYSSKAPIDFKYNIEVHLPPTKDIDVYNAIFRALRENLLNG